MKIGFVSPYDFKKPGGVNSHINGLANELINRGHSVKILGIASEDFKLETGVEFINLGSSFSFVSNGTVSNISLSPIVLWRIKRILNKLNFDVLHIHEPLAPLVSLGALLFSKSPVVATFHASSKKVLKYKFISMIFKSTIEEKIKKKIAVSQEAFRTASTYLPGKFDIISNGIDYHHFADNNLEKINFEEQKKNILFFGRNEPRKGIPILLKAFSILKARNNNYRLILSGPGTDKINPIEYVDEKFCNDVVCLGEIDYNLLPRYFFSSDCFCSPATGNESFGIVILEAMASSLPVVVSDISGYKDLLLNGEMGVLFDNGDSKVLADKLENVIGNSELSEKFVKKGKTYSKKFDWENLAPEILEIYQAVK